MRALLALLLAFGWLTCAYPQGKTETVKDLEAKRTGLQRQIAETDSLLNTTKKDVKSQLGSLATLTSQIEERKRYLRVLGNDVERIEQEIGSLQREIQRLSNDLQLKRDQYAASVRYLQRNRSTQSKLLFILSADNMAQTLRRLRYVREYATFRRLQGEEIKEKQRLAEQKQAELTQAKEEKETLVREQEREQERLLAQEKDKRRIVSNLQKKQKSLQSTVDKQRKEASQLNARIDKLIAEELERERQRAAKAKLTGGGATPTAKAEAADAERADIALTGSFASNRGRLPMPITGPYLITGHYGQYEVEGLRNVRLDNKGIDIQGKPGAQAKAVFDGRVAAVFQFNGRVNLLIRHGQYISVYCNLQSTIVKTGDTVKTGQSLGPVFSDKSDGGRTVLHFQLRKEKEKVDPEPWLRK